MDLFDPGQLDPAGNPTQIHDFNPGTIDSGPAKGLFWTMHIPTRDVHVDLDRATATMRVKDADVEDYHTLKNALLDGPSDPASVSFVIRWRGVKAGEGALDRVQFRLRPRHDLEDHLCRNRLRAKRRLLLLARIVPITSTTLQRLRRR
jgi:hypothetical protein